MPPIAIDVDASKPVEINLVCHSPHVVAYRMWQRVPGEAQWTTVAEGHNSDEVPDHVTIGPLPAGSKYAYYFVVAGNASTDFLVSVALGQEGRAISAGTFIEQGTLDATKRDVRKRTVVFA